MLYAGIDDQEKGLVLSGVTETQSNHGPPFVVWDHRNPFSLLRNSSDNFPHVIFAACLVQNGDELKQYASIILEYIAAGEGNSKPTNIFYPLLCMYPPDTKCYELSAEGKVNIIEMFFFVIFILAYEKNGKCKTKR